MRQQRITEFRQRNPFIQGPVSSDDDDSDEYEQPGELESQEMFHVQLQNQRDCYEQGQRQFLDEDEIEKLA